MSLTQKKAKRLGQVLLCLFAFYAGPLSAQDTNEATEVLNEGASSDTAQNSDATASEDSGENRPVIALPIIVFNREQVLTQSNIGQELNVFFENEKSKILEENDIIYKELEAEELELFELKATLPEEEFNQRADAFDQKVTAAREAQRVKSLELQSSQETDRQELEAFMNASLVQIARNRGAFLVFEINQVYLRSELIDVTDELIAQMNLVSLPDLQQQSGASSAE